MSKFIYFMRDRIGRRLLGDPLVGRRDDVLHGHFVQTDARMEVPSQPLPAASVARVLNPQGEEHGKAVRPEP